MEFNQFSVYGKVIFSFGVHHCEKHFSLANL